MKGQFTIYDNPNPDSRGAYPYFVDVQDTLLDSLTTRVVIPIARADHLENRAISRLCPETTIRGERYVLLSHQLTNVPVAALKAPVGSLRDRRSDIVAALDFLLTGI